LPGREIFDEADRASVQWLQDLTHRTREARPDSRLLLTTRIPLHLAGATPNVEMPPLALPGAIDLLRRQNAADGPRLEQLARLLEGTAAAIPFPSMQPGQPTVISHPRGVSSIRARARSPSLEVRTPAPAPTGTRAARRIRMLAST
jgi:hypothetical protein